MAMKERLQPRASPVSTCTSWLSGSVSGLSVAVLLQPLDVVRTEMQKHEHRGKLTTRMAFAKVVDEHGVTALWRGLVPTVMRVGFGAGMYFSLLNSMSRAWDSSSEYDGGETKLSGPRAFAAGFIARATASITLLPLTVVKTRFEAGDRSHGGTVMTLMHIARKEKIRGLFRGLTPTVMRDAPFSGVYFFAYTKLKTIFSSKEWLAPLPTQVQHFGAGVIAGTVATFITNPFDVIRTRMQLSPAGTLRQNSFEVAKCIIAKEGYSSLALMGLMPRVYKKSLAAAISWTVYEEGVRALSDLQEKAAALENGNDSPIDKGARETHVERTAKL